LVEGGSVSAFPDFPFPDKSDPEESSRIVIVVLGNSCWKDVSC